MDAKNQMLSQNPMLKQYQNVADKNFELARYTRKTKVESAHPSLDQGQIQKRHLLDKAQVIVENKSARKRREGSKESPRAVSKKSRKARLPGQPQYESSKSRGSPSENRASRQHNISTQLREASRDSRQLSSKFKHTRGDSSTQRNNSMEVSSKLVKSHIRRSQRNSPELMKGVLSNSSQLSLYRARWERANEEKIASM